MHMRNAQILFFCLQPVLLKFLRKKSAIAATLTTAPIPSVHTIIL